LLSFFAWSFVVVRMGAEIGERLRGFEGILGLGLGFCGLASWVFVEGL
jgi:hypothetical protein